MDHLLAFPVTPPHTRTLKPCLAFRSQAKCPICEAQETPVATMRPVHTVRVSQGLSQGELLLHVLEERFYMRVLGDSYTSAHLRYTSCAAVPAQLV